MTSQQAVDRREAASIAAYEIWADWREQHEVKLQQRSAPHNAHSNQPRYRFTLLNNWHCGHWHSTIESALACLRRKILRFLNHAA